MARSNRHDVEARRRSGQGRVALQIVGRASDEAALFAPIDAFGRAAKACITAIAYLNEDHRISIAHYEVNLTSARAHVACDRLQALCDEKTAGESLGLGARGLARGGARSAVAVFGQLLGCLQRNGAPAAKPHPGQLALNAVRWAHTQDPCLAVEALVSVILERIERRDDVIGINAKRV